MALEGINLDDIDEDTEYEDLLDDEEDLMRPSHKA
jgi:hypothetical protein